MTLTHDRYVTLGKINAISREQLNTSTGDLRARQSGCRTCACHGRSGQDPAVLGDDLFSDRRRGARSQGLRWPDRCRRIHDAGPVHAGERPEPDGTGCRHRRSRCRRQCAPGAKATFTVDAYPTRKFNATLVSVHNAPKTVQGVVTYQGVLLEKNSDGLLKPGMTATAEIEAATIKNALLVPNAALRFVPPDDVKKGAPPAPPTLNGVNAARVWTQNGKTLKPHDLRLGATDGRSTRNSLGRSEAGRRGRHRPRRQADTSRLAPSAGRSTLIELRGRQEDLRIGRCRSRRVGGHRSHRA